MKKSITKLVLMGAVIGLLLSGCGSPDSNNPSTDKPGSEKSPAPVQKTENNTPDEFINGDGLSSSNATKVAETEYMVDKETEEDNSEYKGSPIQGISVGHFSIFAMSDMYLQDIAFQIHSENTEYDMVVVEATNGPGGDYVGNAYSFKDQESVDTFKAHLKWAKENL